MFSFLLGKIPRTEIAGSYDKCMLNFLKNHQTCFLKGLCYFTFPPAIQEGSNFSTSSLIIIILIVVCLFDYGNFSEYKVVFHCGFDFYVP